MIADPCGLCPTDGTTMPWKDLRLNADWMARIHTAAGWQRASTDRFALVTLPGVSILNCMCDIMHNKHMGVDMYFCGSVLFILCYVLLPDSVQHNLDVVMTGLRRHTLRQKTFSNIRLFMSVKDVDNPKAAYPRLKRQVAEVRHFGKVLLDIWQAHMDAGNLLRLHRSVPLGLMASVRMETILDENAGA